MDTPPAPAAPRAPSPAPSGEPLDVGTLISAGTAVTLDNAGVIAGVWAVCGLPPQLLGLALTRLGLVDKESLKASIIAHDWNALGPLAAIGAVSLLFGLLCYATTLVLTASAHRGRPLSLSDALLGGASRMIASAAASFVVGCAVLAGALALIVPGFFLTIRLSLAVCATVIEGAGPLDGVSRSWALTEGHFWGVVGRLAAFFGLALLGTIVLFFGGLVLGLIARRAGDPGAVAARLAVNAFQFLVTAWVSACVTKLYLDLARLRDA